MPVEMEAKIKVDSCEPTRGRLRELGARRLYTAVETNRLFDTADQSLFRRGCGMRIRTCRGEGEVPAATWTYKGPQLAGPLKTRDELETEVADAEAAVGIIVALGYRPAITFEKRREEWELDGLKIELDELPRLGCFVEIEGPDEPAVRRMQDKLGLAGESLVRDTYIALLINHAREHGLDWSQITFEERK